VEFISFTDVKGDLPFKMSVEAVNGRWYMYAGVDSHSGNIYVIVDISVPAHPGEGIWVLRYTGSKPGPAISVH
jgi:hypothetical protein